jgi:hypothetical protein
VNRALLLLTALQVRGWARYLGRSVRTVKGALLAVVGVCVFIPWVLTMALQVGRDSAADTETVRRLGPAVLLGYCLLNLVLSTGERAIYFSPAEVNFLFPGPFSRRQVLAYKIMLTLLVALPTALVMALVVRVRDTWPPAAFLGMLLLLAFVQLFSMSLGLLAAAAGASLYTRGRRLAVAAAVVVAAVIVLQAGGLTAGRPPKQLLEAALQTPVWRVVSLPLGWFFETLLAARLWPDLVLYGLLATAVNAVLVVGIFALDAQYLETSAAASARLYARLQRLRGRSVDAGESGPRAPRVVRTGLPMPPWWGGVGPTLWRQLTAAMRGTGRMVLLMLVLVAGLAGPLMAGAVHDEAAVVWTAVSMAGAMTVFLTTVVAFDFRGDIDRMGVLKTLPVHAWRLALAELVTPVLVLSVLQWLLLAGILAVAETRRGQVLLVAVYVPPFNFILVALDNLLFLLFPVRLMAATPGDFQALGRNVLLAFGKFAGLIAAGLAAGLAGGAVWLATGNVAAVVAVSWLVACAAGAALVPFVALAFKAFDVSRDTPA